MSAEAHPFAVTTARGRRRKTVGKLAELLATLAALIAVAVLAIVIISVAKRGAGALSWDFFTKTPVPFGQTGGGIENSIIGSLYLTGMATAISVPVGVLIAIYNTEFAPKQIAEVVRLVLNVLAGVPTIVIGLFIFGLLVEGHGQSAIAGSVALSIVMLPLVARSTEEVLRLVPPALREGGMALGATRARTVVTIILPTAVGGIVTATILAVARAAGETAPLLFTSSIAANVVTTDVHQAMSSLPFAIFTGSESPSPQDQQQAWAAALVLMAVVLIGGIIGRLLSLRTRRQIEQAR
jgi:phosphate transport system permease protein